MHGATVHGYSAMVLKRAKVVCSPLTRSAPSVALKSLGAEICHHAPHVTDGLGNVTMSPLQQIKIPVGSEVIRLGASR